MLVSSKTLLSHASQQNYAIPAFNFYNLDTLMAVVQAAETEQAPIIAQIYFTHYTHYRGGSLMSASALDLIRQSSAPIALHLDHSTSFDAIMYAIRCGFNSVMIDGSALPLEENIQITKKVVEIAHSLGIYTEAELGRIVRIGVDGDGADNDYTDVRSAEKLVSETGVDSFAPAIGTAHGIYLKPPQLQFSLLQEIADAVKVPIVLHGGSGIPDDAIVKSIKCGVRKINVGTELKYTWDSAVGQALADGQKEIIAISKIATEAVYQVAKRKIHLFEANGKAPAILAEATKMDV